MLKGGVGVKNEFSRDIAVLIRRRVSDLYVLPYRNYYRLLTMRGGRLRLYQQLPLSTGQRLIAYLKYRADMAVSEHRRPQAGSLCWHAPSQTVDLRLSSVGDYRGQESLVVRFIYRLRKDYRILIPAQWQSLLDNAKQRGLMLFAGPMGSGKTTTMYRLARQFAKQQVVMTIEDPVEIDEPSFIQLQVNELAQMSYQQLLKVGLRHRPQIFIIGEIRDPRTAQMAIQAALSGHLVLATVHARNVYGVMARLAQLSIEPYYLQQAVNSVCYQRLLPTTKDHEVAVMFDLLSGDELQTGFVHRKVGMTSAWSKQLAACVASGKLAPSVAEYYQAG